MIYYAIAAIFPLFMWGLNDYMVKYYRLDGKKKEALRNKMAIIAIVPMFLLFVLRYKYVGVDTIGYVRFFQEEIRRYSFFELFDQELMRSEIGYRLYVKIISLFTDNYTVYFAVNGVVIFGTLLHFTKTYTKNPFIFFFAFMTLGTYSFIETGLRQALAMMICLWAVGCIRDKKPLRFVLLVVFAFLFHKSALIFLLIYPLAAIKKYDWMIATYVAVMGILFVGFAGFQDIFNQLLGYNYEVEETGNGMIFMMLVLVLFVFSLFLMRDKPKEVNGQNLIVQMSLMTVLFWVLRLVSRTAERISYYFIYGLYIYFSQAVLHDKDRFASLFKWILILTCFVLFVYRNLGTSYQFFFQGA